MTRLLLAGALAAGLCCGAQAATIAFDGELTVRDDGRSMGPWTIRIDAPDSIVFDRSLVLKRVCFDASLCSEISGPWDQVAVETPFLLAGGTWFLALDFGSDHQVSGAFVEVHNEAIGYDITPVDPGGVWSGFFNGDLYYGDCNCVLNGGWRVTLADQAVPEPSGLLVIGPLALAFVLSRRFRLPSPT